MARSGQSYDNRWAGHRRVDARVRARFGLLAMAIAISPKMGSEERLCLYEELLSQSGAANTSEESNMSKDSECNTGINELRK